MAGVTIMLSPCNGRVGIRGLVHVRQMFYDGAPSPAIAKCLVKCPAVGGTLTQIPPKLLLLTPYTSYPGSRWHFWMLEHKVIL